MNNIKNIIFDLGGVILNLDNKRTENAFIALGVKDFGAHFGHGHAASFFLAYEVGKIDDAEFVSGLRKMIGSEVSDEDIIRAWNVMLLDFPPERIALLQKLKKRYRVFLFSNNNALHLAAVQKIYRETFKDSELDDHFEKSYYSHTLGMRKPELEPFYHILKENNLDPAETLFVDDALVNIEGAEAAGLKGCFIKPGTTIMDVDWGV